MASQVVFDNDKEWWNQLSIFSDNTWQLRLAQTTMMRAGNQEKTPRPWSWTHARWAGSCKEIDDKVNTEKR